jgi:hypothetical protein
MDYKVSLQTEILEEGIPLEHLFSNGSGQPAHPLYGIFLITSKDETAIWEPGTGFLISENGLFATAKHVLTDSYGYVLDSLIGIQVFRNEGIVLVSDIVDVQPHDKADVAIGFLKYSSPQQSALNSVFELTSSAPPIDEKIATYAMPRPDRAMLNSGRIEMPITPLINYGNVIEHFPTGRDSVMVPGNSYRTSLTIHGGCSGGPVFWGDGRVFGINSMGMGEWEDSSPEGYVSSITDILDLTVSRKYLESNSDAQAGISIRELCERGYILLSQ